MPLEINCLLQFYPFRARFLPLYHLSNARIRRANPFKPNCLSPATQDCSGDPGPPAEDYTPRRLFAPGQARYVPASIQCAHGPVRCASRSIPLTGPLRILSTGLSSCPSVESSPLVLRLSHALLLNLPSSAPSNSASSPDLCSAPVFLLSVIGLFLFRHSSSFFLYSASFALIRLHSRMTH